MLCEDENFKNNPSWVFVLETKNTLCHATAQVKCGKQAAVCCLKGL